VRSAAKRYAVRSATTRRWCDDCGAFLPVTEMSGGFDARLGRMRYACSACTGVPEGSEHGNAE